MVLPLLPLRNGARLPNLTEYTLAGLDLSEEERERTASITEPLQECIISQLQDYQPDMRCYTAVRA